MKATWEKAIEFVLRWEGGYSNDPNDPGGETNFGISKKAHPSVDIKNLTKEEAKEIYKRKYWNVIHGDELPWPMDIILFDTAVNLGVAQAIKIHDNTRGGVDYLFKRIGHYASLKNANLYLRGWINRVLSLYDEIKKGNF